MYINVLEMLEDNVRDNPDRVALCDSKRSISYRELHNDAKAIATYIVNEIGKGKVRKPIAVCIDRNIESIILFMGVLYSGNFYVPIDINMPSERIGIIFEDLKPEMILSSDNQKIEGYEIADISVICKTVINEEILSTIRSGHIDTDPMYAIFTSGSTGRPKGVLVGHRSVIDLVSQFDVAFNFHEMPVFGNQAPFDFDVSVKDIYNALYQHGTVCVIPKQCFSMPLTLIEYINEKKIDTIIWAVSAMRIVENFKTFEHLIPEGLKLVMFSGEIMPVKVLNYWRQYVKDATYVNLYGPTEITCNCSYYIVDREYEPDEALPIGVPFRNTQIILLDTESGKVITEKNKQGEICVRGICLALGYYNAPERTAESFADSPLSNAYPERIYKTGDLGYIDDRGLLQFTSRKDYQIKHMGHRIELGEIEVAVNAIDYIDAAVCVFDRKKEKIVLFYQANKGGEQFETAKALEKNIVKCLSAKLQKYMWPNVYIAYDKLPLNKNGKIDRVYLAKTLE
ncbi:MAG: amino acid adenylation domain-containing protein [Lachnospiraceae bacterium]|nr:amino acid adenylation domain-containing protein [Candidatus Colinaster scatohippi]